MSACLPFSGFRGLAQRVEERMLEEQESHPISGTTGGDSLTTALPQHTAPSAFITRGHSQQQACQELHRSP